jgi:4-hydroxybenzoate polyprenyltransferase
MTQTSGSNVGTTKKSPKRRMGGDYTLPDCRMVPEILDQYTAPMIAPWFRALRPTQWVKNVFVLAPLVFAERLADPFLLSQALLAFLTFCAAASCIYLVNDLRDREEDRRHPLKKSRPIASGALSSGAAVTTAVVLGIGALAGAFFLGNIFMLLLGIYLAINLLYSSWLKHIVILDVMAVSSGYVLRVMAGAAAVEVEVSKWLLLCTTFLALFLIFSKRRHELVLLGDSAADHRAVLGHYSAAFLDQMINVVTASTVVSFALYAVDDHTVERFGSEALIYTLPLVLYGIFRYLYLIYQKNEIQDPTIALLKDPALLISVALWGVAVLAIVYL